MVDSALLPDVAGGVVDPGAIATRLAASLPPTTVVVGRLPRRAAWPTGAGSPRRRIDPSMRFSRTRLTDVLHHRQSGLSSTSPMAPRRDDGFQRGLIKPRRFGELYVTTRQPYSRPLMAFGHKQRESVVRVVPVRWIRMVIPFRGGLTMPLGQRSDCAVFDRLREAARARRSSVVVVSWRVGVGETRLCTRRSEWSSI